MTKGFGSDNHSGIHPELLQAIINANTGHAPSYGTDTYSQLAISEFKKHFGESCQVFFVFNGTAANVLSLRAMTESYNAVLCSDVSHLNVDECGSPEVLAQTKLIPIKSTNGKISLPEIKKKLIRRGDQHYSQINVISLTQPTELASCYSAEEIKEICDWAHANQIYVHIDGARLANACVSLNSHFSDFTSKCGVDVVSFGGTKNGFLFGEAIIFLNPDLADNFHFIRKQFCQLPSKSRFLAAQFHHYLNSGLWEKIARHSCQMAQKLFTELQPIQELKLSIPPQSNAIFPYIPKAWLKPLREHSFFYVWDETVIDQSLQCRIMTSWDTEIEDIQLFKNKILELRQNRPVHSSEPTA